MSTKEVLSSLKEGEKYELQKQLGCMNGIFQLFDRRYLLGQRRRSNSQKRRPSGESVNGEKEFENTSEQAKEKTTNVVSKEKSRVSVDLPRNSFSSSSSSTVMSSFDCSKRVQTEQSSSCQSVVSEYTSSPFVHRKQPDLFMPSPDIRDVVKDSMTREPRVVSIKNVTKAERVGPAMKHVDSPRPFPQQKPVQYDRNDRNLVKLKELQCGVEKVKEMSRFSYDGRESRYQLKSNMKIKELPRLSLDSRKGYISNSANDSVSNRRPSSSSVVARLMGLEVLTTSVNESKTTLKTNICESEELVSNSRLLKKEEELKLDRDRSYVSPRVHKPQRGVRVRHVVTKIPLETAPWKQESGVRLPQKPIFKSKESPPRAEPASTSIYGEIEKRLTEHEYKTSGKDLRALKQILEAMQKTKKRLENNEHDLENSSQKVEQPVSPTINGISPRKVKQADARKDFVGSQRLKDPTPRDRKATARPLSPSNFQEYSGTVSPRMQRSKNVIDTPSSDLSRPKKQRSMQRTLPSSTTRNPKAKSVNSLQDSSETRNLSQHSDTLSFHSESYSVASQNDSEVTSTEWVQEVSSPFRPKENYRVNNIAERFIEERSIVDQAKHTMDQPSPVSVLDAFYTEDTPSPVKKKLIAFNDDETLQFEETPNQGRNLGQFSEFNNVKLHIVKNIVHQIELLSTNTDETTVNHASTSSSEGETGEHRYVAEILFASGCLKDLDRTTTIVQLNPAGSLINPELFHVLEKTKGCTDDGYRKWNTRSQIRRKLVFDTVNDVLGHKLAMLGPFGPRANNHLNGDRLLRELCSGIDSLQHNSERDMYDEEDEVINIINADVNKRSQDWDEYWNQVPGLVLDIERLIFKDLISEVVNAQVTSLQDWPVRHRRQLFPV